MLIAMLGIANATGVAGWQLQQVVLLQLGLGQGSQHLQVGEAA